MRALVHVVQDKQFVSARELAEYFNIPHDTIETRLSRGWSAVQAVELEAPPKESHKSYNMWIKVELKERVCSGCKQQKPLTEYYKRPKSDAGDFGSRCKTCVKLDVRHSSRKRQYGLNKTQWEDLFVSQGSRCAICLGTDPQGNTWQTDHCHTVGTLRGILCRPCNLMLGYARDNKETLLSAIEYLDRYIDPEEIA